MWFKRKKEKITIDFNGALVIFPEDKTICIGSNKHFKLDKGFFVKGDTVLSNENMTEEKMIKIFKDWQKWLKESK